MYHACVNRTHRVIIEQKYISVMFYNLQDNNTYKSIFK